MKGCAIIVITVGIILILAFTVGILGLLTGLLGSILWFGLQLLVKIVMIILIVLGVCVLVRFVRHKDDDDTWHRVD